ncbi:olfactory receptor 6E1-like [Alligator mississippiensis]|uniref:olfactory receptor 6E1-like n=1 Tax=Alligator mississippiensis TaxID=8496 RepID=UPI002877A1FB|nr:olfactory receptor 6E1-like [Alligator mississippiensis]
MENQTGIREFILLGFTDIWELQILLFVLLTLTYSLTITGNLLIIAITLLDHRLQTPMYFFLRNFSLLEIGFTTAVVPEALANLALGTTTISFLGCLTQSFLYFFLGTTEFLLLAAMSFDRYVAICNPLRYTTVMNTRVCSLLVLGSWIEGFLFVLFPTIVFLQLPFCGSNILNHFFCDNTPLMKLLCGDTQLLELISFITAVLSLLGTLIITVVSYSKIILTVMRIPSNIGRQKAFSTCISHLTVVSITYGTCIFLYIKPTQSNGLGTSKAIAVLNTVVSPLLNPFIYSLRNKEVQSALRDAVSRAWCFQRTWELHER